MGGTVAKKLDICIGFGLTSVDYITRRFIASSGGLKSNLNKKMKTKNVATLRSRKSSGHALVRRSFVLIVVALTCFALTPPALAKKKKKKTPTPTGIIHSTRLFVEGSNPIDLTNFTGLSLQ